MGVRRAQDKAERHARQDDVVDKAAATPEKTEILGPENRLPQAVSAGGTRVGHRFALPAYRHGHP